MRTNLSSQISLSHVAKKLYKPDDVFELSRVSRMEKVKTTNMGTLYELDYEITLKDEHSIKAFIDELRCRNGNLNIVCGKPVTAREAI